MAEGIGDGGEVARIPASARAMGCSGPYDGSRQITLRRAAPRAFTPAIAAAGSHAAVALCRLPRLQPQ
jgi:hypothetical protein